MENRNKQDPGKSSRMRRNLFRMIPPLKAFVRMRSFQFIAVFPGLALLYFFLIAGLYGSPVGNRNIIIIIVWILWWFLLITLMVPLLSRFWCILCPIPFFGDWLQRRSLVMVRPGKTGNTRNAMFGLNKRWPKRLSNLWLQNAGFLCLATIFVVLATRPVVSAVVIGGMVILATVIAGVYQRRSFCRYLCPVGGFLGVYSMSSAVELRSVDPDVCERCRTKNCSTGSEKGWACPWFLSVSTLDRNNFCGLCMECVKSCPSDNVGLYVRPLFSDRRLIGLDEVWKACIMLALALLYSVVLLGPWGFLRDWANVTATGDWRGFLLYAALVWGSGLAVVPGLWWLTAYLSHRMDPTGSAGWKQLFVAYAFVLVPLGLGGWMAFSLPLIAVNGSYILSVISDPLGRGWDLFGTASIPWSPVYPHKVVWLQMVIVIAALGFSLDSGRRICRGLFGGSRKALRTLIPVAVFCTAAAAVFLMCFGG